MSEFVQEQQPEPRVLPPRMTERVQALTELRRDETTTPAPRVPTAFVERLQQFMRQENIGVRALAIRLGKSHGIVSKWLTGKNVCNTQAEVLHELGLGPPPPPAEPPTRKRRKQLQGMSKAIRIIRKATKRPVIIQLRPIKAEPAS
eukprot:COSAG03_NODE_3458_length_1999_cov_1.548947_1_plen_146_part_00